MAVSLIRLGNAADPLATQFGNLVLKLKQGHDPTDTAFAQAVGNFVTAFDQLDATVKKVQRLEHQIQQISPLGVSLHGVHNLNHVDGALNSGP